MILIGVIVAALIGPGAVLSWRLQDGVRRDLRARDASVRLVAGPIDLTRGHVARLTVFARAAALDTMSMDEVHLDLRSVTLDPARALGGELVLRDVGSGTAMVVVGEESLRRYLADARGFRNAGVQMDNGTVTITGQLTVLNALVDVSLRAGLLVRDGRSLALDVQQLRVSGLEVPRDVGNALVISINPILTAPERPVPLRFTGVTVDDGVARIAAEVAR